MRKGLLRTDVNLSRDTASSGYLLTGFERARLQPCRKQPQIARALAPEGCRLGEQRVYEMASGLVVASFPGGGIAKEIQCSPTEFFGGR